MRTVAVTASVHVMLLVNHTGLLQD